MSHQEFYETVQREEEFLEMGMKNISKALVQAQKSFAPALKTSSNPHFKSKYAALDACVEAVIDSLNSNGIYLMQQTHEAEGGVIVETTFIHESGEQMSCGRLQFPATKNDPQGYASALTYARRYSLMAACGIAPEDDDGNAAVKAQHDEDAKLVKQYEEAAQGGIENLQAFHSMVKGPSKDRVWKTHGDRIKALAKQVRVAA